MSMIDQNDSSPISRQPDGPEEAGSPADETLRAVQQMMAAAASAAPHSQLADGQDETIAEPIRKPRRGNRRWAATALRFLGSLVLRRDEAGRLRPRMARIGVALIVLAVVLRPWAVFGFVLGVAMILIVAYLTLGPERFAELWTSVWERACRRFPKKTAEIARRLGRLRQRFAWGAERLPGRLADRFAPPEPLPQTVQNRLDADPFDRLSGS